MSHSTSTFTDAQGSLELLRAIVSDGARNHVFPADAAVRARQSSAPWLVDDLLRAGWLALVGGQRLVPTIAGLRAAGGPEAEHALAAARLLFDDLRAAYRARPSTLLTSHELAARGQKEPAEVGALLSHLAASDPGLFGLAQFDQEMRPGGVTPLPLILTQNPFQTVADEAEAAEPAHVTLALKDFMGLAQVEWSPRGVCVLAGANGSGKTSLLHAFGFLRDCVLHGVPGAVALQRGAVGLRRVTAAGPPEIFLGLTVGQATWELRLSADGASVGELPGEILKVGSGVLLRAASYSPHWYLGPERKGRDGRTCLGAVWDLDHPAPVAPLVAALKDYYCYGPYALGTLRMGGGGAEGDARLAPNGENLFVVLRNWHGAPRAFRGSFEWVLKHLRQAFPGVLDAIEFDPPVGATVTARFYLSGTRSTLPMHRASDGLLVGLLHLCAVAGAPDGSVVAIDDVECQLHPHAIRSILAAFDELAEQRQLTILLATQSPIVMNAFRGRPEQLYVFEAGHDVQPVQLDQVHDPDWLVHFELGELYDRLEFGAPARELVSCHGKQSRVLRNI